MATRGWLETSEVKADGLGEGVSRARGEDVHLHGYFTRWDDAGSECGGDRRDGESIGTILIASGGVSQYEDLQKLAEYAASGVSGAIVGKALYTGVLSVKLSGCHQPVE